MSSDAPLNPLEWRGVADYLRRFERAGAPLETRIHPSDEMFGYEFHVPYRTRETAAVMYLATGYKIFQTLEEVVGWRFQGFAGVRSFLDFASGYGRLTRFLVRDLAPDRIAVSEIDPAGLRFQEETFGVRAITSGSSPQDFRPGATFDVIFAASFFSHMPAASFEAWLSRLRGCLAPGGILVFSVHGMHLLPEGERDPSTGIVFRDTSTTSRLDAREYGITWVTPEYVAAATERVTGGEARLLSFRSGLAGFQDLYVLMQPPVPALPELRLKRFPAGECDHSAIGDDGIVSAEGWVQGDVDEPPPDTRLYLANEVATVQPGSRSAAPGSRQRWRFTFPISAVSVDDVVRVEAESARGRSCILVAAAMRPFLSDRPV